MDERCLRKRHAGEWMRLLKTLHGQIRVRGCLLKNILHDLLKASHCLSGEGESKVVLC